jgi:hypothetical protein
MSDTMGIRRVSICTVKRTKCIVEVIVVEDVRTGE